MGEQAPSEAPFPLPPMLSIQQQHAGHLVCCSFMLIFSALCIKMVQPSIPVAQCVGLNPLALFLLDFLDIAHTSRSEDTHSACRTNGKYGAVGTGPNQMLADKLPYSNQEGRFCPPHRFVSANNFDIPAPLCTSKIVGQSKPSMYKYWFLLIRTNV